MTQGQRGHKNAKGPGVRLAVVTPPRLSWYQVAVETHLCQVIPSAESSRAEPNRIERVETRFVLNHHHTHTLLNKDTHTHTQFNFWPNWPAT